MVQRGPQVHTPQPVGQAVKLTANMFVSDFDRGKTSKFTNEATSFVKHQHLGLTSIRRITLAYQGGGVAFWVPDRLFSKIHTDSTAVSFYADGRGFNKIKWVES